MIEINKLIKTIVRRFAKVRAEVDAGLKLIRDEKERKIAKAVCYMAIAKRAKALFEPIESEGKDTAKELFEKYGLSSLAHDAGVVTIKEVAGSKRLDTTIAKKFLSAEQLEVATKTSEPTLRVEFTATHED